MTSELDWALSSDAEFSCPHCGTAGIIAQMNMCCEEAESWWMDMIQRSIDDSTYHQVIYVIPSRMAHLIPDLFPKWISLGNTGDTKDVEN